MKAMPKETPTWEELEAGYTLRPSEEYFKQFEFEEAEDKNQLKLFEQ